MLRKYLKLLYLTELLRHGANLESSANYSVLFSIFSYTQMAPFSSVTEQMSRAAAATDTMWPTFWSTDAPHCTCHCTDLSEVVWCVWGLCEINPKPSCEEDIQKIQGVFRALGRSKQAWNWQRQSPRKTSLLAEWVSSLTKRMNKILQCKAASWAARIRTKQFRLWKVEGCVVEKKKKPC